MDTGNSWLKQAKSARSYKYDRYMQQGLAGGHIDPLKSNSNIQHQMEAALVHQANTVHEEPMITRQDVQKSVQVVTIQGTSGSNQVSIPGLFANFTQSIDVQNKPVKYNIHQINISSQINNVYRDMAVSLTATCTFLDTTTGDIITIDGSQQPITTYLVNLSEEESIQQSLQDSGSCKSTEEYINDMQSNLTTWVQQQLIAAQVAGSYTSIYNDIQTDEKKSLYPLYEVLMSSFLQFSPATGKLQMLTRDVNLFNLYAVTINGVVYEPGRLFKQNLTLELNTSNSNSLKTQFKVKRLLGMGRDINNEGVAISDQSLFALVFSTGTEMTKWLTKTYDADTVIFNVPSQQFVPIITSYDYYALPCNALATNYVNVTTTLNTNQWSDLGKKVNVLMTVWMQKGFSETNQTIIQDKHIHNEDVINNFKNFRIELYDEYGDIVTFNQSYTIDIAIHVKGLI